MTDRQSRFKVMPRALALILVAALLALPAAAQSRQVRTTVGETAAPPSFVISGETASLTLADAIEIALDRNLDLELQRYDRSTSLFRIEQSESIYDLGASLSVGVSENTSPSSSQLDGAAVIDSNRRDLSFGLSQLTPYGGTAQFSLTADRSSTNSSFSFIDPSYSANGSLTYSQPLLRGFGKLSTERSILQARINSDSSQELFEQEVTRIVQAVEQAYWSLVDAREQLVVAQESLDLAEELDERNRVQVDVGTLAPIELVQSEATVATRQEGIIQAQTTVGDAADRLLQLLNVPPGELWDAEIVPETPSELERIEIDSSAALEQAYDQRPELRRSELGLQVLEIDSQFFQREKLPNVDLVVGYGAGGLGGRGNIPDPITGDPVRVDEDLIDALDEVASRDFDGWNLRVNVGYAFQNRNAKAQSAIADLALERAQKELDQLRLQIRTEVRAAVRQLDSAAQRIDTARASRRAQERNLEAEQKRYENGMSTSYQVTEIQEDLSQARSREVSAITEYRNALTEFYRATGQLLDVSSIELVAAGD
ncbi:MAG: TolC family protein [Acidobacteriota bacterium]